MYNHKLKPGSSSSKRERSSAGLKKGGSWKCEHGAKCMVPCIGCPFVNRPTERILCKMCHGLGYVSIKNGEDAADCPRCEGTGRA